MIVAPGCFQEERLREKRGDEVAGNELTGAVDEETAVGVTVPCDADVGVLGHDPIDDVLPVRFDQRIGFMVGEPAIDLEAQSRRPAGQTVEELRRDQPAHPAAGIEHDVERPDDGRIDERHHVLEVRLQHVLLRDLSAARGWRRKPIGGDHVPNLHEALVAAERKRLLPHHLRAVVLLRVVRGRDLRAAVALIPRNGEVQHVGRNHPVVHDIGALQRRPVDERRGERRRGQPHVAANGDLPGLQVRDEAPARSPARSPRRSDPGKCRGCRRL